MRRFIERLLAWFRKPKIVPEVPFTAMDETPALIPTAPTTETDDPDDWRNMKRSHFHFRGTLLDRLPFHFKALQHIKRHDPDAFELFSRIGVHLLPSDNDSYVAQSGLNPTCWFATNRPSFGAVAFGWETVENDDDIGVLPALCYFQKFDNRKAPPDIQRISSGWDIYLVSEFFDSERYDGDRIRFCVQFPIAVGPLGELQVLRTRLHSQHQTRATRGKDRGRLVTIPAKSWGIERGWKDTAAEHGQTPTDFLKGLFVLTTSAFEFSQQAMVRVGVNKGGLSTVFSIDPRRSAYFFRDRDRLPGTRKKIFHIVRPHLRLTGNRTSAVKMHFRGERDFVWNGYGIHLTVPGLHHNLITDLKEGAKWHPKDEPRPEGTLDARQTGQIIQRYVNGSDPQQLLKH